MAIIQKKKKKKRFIEAYIETYIIIQDITKWMLNIEYNPTMMFHLS